MQPHTPLMHDMPPRKPHVIPQAPQLALSVCRFTQAPLHRVNPPLQPWHMPPTHAPPEQALPHWPQLRASLWILTQRLLQLVSPPPQVHAPATQVPPPLHTVPQAPQSAKSVWRSTQAPLQLVSPVAHIVTHVDCEHTCPLAQTAVHEPQCWGSEPMSMQTPLQRVSIPGQAHAPDAHTVPPVQLTPQAPQFFGSDWRSTQA
jgi:hypothetical protein